MVMAATKSASGHLHWKSHARVGAIRLPLLLPAAPRYAITKKASTRFSGCRTGIAASMPIDQPPASVIRSLISLQPRSEKIVESEGRVNKKLVVSAAAVCFLTHVLTVQGMLLTAYLAAATAVPVGAVNHAIKKRNAWPALCILMPLLLVPHVGFLRGLYMNVVNPVSVQIRARITLPALIHAFVGSKHPALRAGLKSAQVASQVVLLVLLLQYLFAPKIAEAMRQRAIMLCRAFTTTESQGMKVRNGDSTMETWPNKHVRAPTPREGPEDFLQSISRGDPRRWESHDFERLEKLRETVSRNLPEGTQPSIAEFYGHEETAGSQYSYVGARRAGEVKLSDVTVEDTDAGRSFSGSHAWDGAKESLRTELTDLDLGSESDAAAAKAVEGILGELDTVVDSISSPEDLFAVLNEQLNLVQNLAHEVRDQGTALRHSEEAREDLVRELEATVGEKRQLGQELTAMALKFEAAQSMWERHLEHGSFNDLVTEEVLDKVVDALTERNQAPSGFPPDAEDAEEFEIVDGDALAARFRNYHYQDAESTADGSRHSFSDEAQPTIQHNVQPFGRFSSSKAPSEESVVETCS